MEISKAYTKSRPVSQETVQSTGEYVLPDYQGDVRKVLYSRARATSPSKYQSADVVESVGVVAYDVIYLDTDGVMTPVSFTTDYEAKFRCDGETYVDSKIDARVAGYAIRLMGPRKFSVKASVECECTESESAEYTVEGQEALSDGAELLCATAGIERVAFGEGDEVELAEDIDRIDGAIADEVEVLLVNAEPHGVSVSRTDDGVEVRAEISVSALIKCADKMPYTATRELGLVSNITAPDIDDEMHVEADVDILSLTTSVNPEESGVAVVFNMIAAASVFGISNTPLRIVEDCYCTDVATSCDSGDFSYSEYLASKNHTEKISASIPRGEANLENARNVLFASAIPKAEDVRIGDKTISVSGNLRFSGIACEINEDGDISYAPVKLDVPFSVDVNYDVQIPVNSRASVRLEVTGAKLELDAASVIPSANLTIRTHVSTDERRRCVKSVKLLEEKYESDPSLLTVYYPEPGESLFDVGKKFHTSTMQIARENELSDTVCATPGSRDGLSGINYLIITK